MPAYTCFTVAGAGHLGAHVAKALLRHGFKVALLSRSGTSSNLKALEEAGATIHAVDYSDAKSISKAIAGSQVVINTLGIDALQSTAQNILIDESKKAGVQLFVPNDWGYDYDFSANAGVAVHPFMYVKATVRPQLKKLGLPYLQFFPGHSGSHLATLFEVDREARTVQIAGAGNSTFVSTAVEDVHSELENSTLRVSKSSHFTANELFEQVEKRDGKQWIIEHTSLEQAKVPSLNSSLGLPSFSNWIAYAIDQGAANYPDDNARVGFQSSVNLVDLVLGKASS